jgi:hypothetical protein
LFSVFSNFRRLLWLSLSAGLLATVPGCLSFYGHQPVGTNAVHIPSSQYDLQWERAVAVLNDNHFLIARESKLEGVIETHYRAGANVLEPWHQDSVGLGSRLESTLQSIRRRVIVTFRHASGDAMLVSVRVEKEIEDLPGIAANYEGGATFPEANPLDRDLTQVLGQSSPSRWIPLGTDSALEGRLMHQIQHAQL